MSEGTRRSAVKRFVHRTNYPDPRLLRPWNLFEHAILGQDREWLFALSGSDAPPAGSRVLVRVTPGRGLDIVWGNEAVASLTDDQQNELAGALAQVGGSEAVAAAVVSGYTAPDRIAVRLLQPHG